MTEQYEELCERHRYAIDRYRTLQIEAEQASDRGGRGPSPIEIAEARLEVLSLRTRALRARDAMQQHPTIHLGGIR
jgi:hypothetical protein